MSAPYGMLLFTQGFRPFFLFGAMFAVFAISYFILFLSGTIENLPSRWDIISWHRHEMLFGFSGAIIAGFLFTAVPNWTGQQTPKGFLLAMIVLLWGMGRIFVFSSIYLPTMLVAAADISFFLACMLGIMPALIKSHNHRNYIFLVFLTLLVFANGLTHFGNADTGILLARNIILLMIIIIGGRVIPFFTQNSLGITISRNHHIEHLAIFSTALSFITEVFGANNTIIGVCFLVAAIANALRLSQWQSFKTFRVPLTWILHIGYTWITLGLALKSAYYLGFALPASIATHALTVGAIGSWTLGMMSRVSLGHSGRPLVVKRIMVFAFCSIFITAIVRVFVVWLFPKFTVQWLEIASLLWISAFGIFVYIYAPILTRPKICSER